MHAATFRVQPSGDFAAGYLAVGIGPECGGMVDGMVRAPWFAHLRGTISSPGGRTGRALGRDGVQQLLAATANLYVASIALPALPSQVEVDFACELAEMLWCRVFVIVTSACVDPEVLARLGGACDCLVRGDGGAMHHWYPVRTALEPAIGRLICYDLGDACALWAGKMGEYGSFDPLAAGLHVEVPSTVPTLKDVGAIIDGFQGRLDDPDAAVLANVVEGGLTGVATVSFQRSRLVRQERAAA